VELTSQKAHDVLAGKVKAARMRSGKMRSNA
jgi:hypothetical protein